MTVIAVFLVGLWLIIQSQTAVSATFTLIIGTVVCVLAALEVVSSVGVRRNG